MYDASFDKLQIRDSLVLTPEAKGILNISRRVEASRLLLEATMFQCPECESELDIEEDEVDEGEIVSCPECGTDFEVITTNPLELKAVEEGYEEDEEEMAEES